MTDRFQKLLAYAKECNGPDHYHEMIRDIEATPPPNLPDSIRLGLVYELNDAAEAWGRKVPSGVKDHSLARMRLLGAYFAGESTVGKEEAK